jgi:creatinine amidohydrolase
MTIHFEELTSPEIADAAKKNTLILFPIGQVEEHGNHLPLNTDVVIAEETARLVAERVKDEIPVLVTPAVWAGYSAKVMQRWPGTIRVRTRVLMDYTFDISASLIQMGFRRICLINGHGHHPELLRVVIREITDEYGVHMVEASPAAFSAKAYAAIRKSKPGGSIHGGEWETSLMLFFKQRVQMEKATDRDRFRYESESVPGDGFSGSKKMFWSTWGLQESETGIYGDPTCADPETGKKIVEGMVEEYRKFLREYWKHGKGK